MVDPVSPRSQRLVSRAVDAPVDAVWAVIGDGWLYSNWVVGASRVRDVSPTWPQEGSAIQHSFGVWPAVVDDETLSLQAEAPHLLRLQARGWPFGEAHVELSITRESGTRCTVSILEDAVSGPGTLIPRPVRQAAIAIRNKEALRRLALIAEGRHRAWTGTA